MKSFYNTTIILLALTFNAKAQQLYPKIDHGSFNEWQHPIIKRLQAKDPTLIAYGAKDKWVNIAIVDKKDKVIYYVSCVGFVKDITDLTDYTYNRFITNKEDPFQYYDRLINDGLQMKDAVIQKFRYPKTKATLKGVPEYDNYITQELHQTDTLKTELEKIELLHLKRQYELYSYFRANTTAPNKVIIDTTFIKYLSNVKKAKYNLANIQTAQV